MYIVLFVYIAVFQPITLCVYLFVFRYRIQSILSYKLYKLKKGEALKFKKIIDDHNKVWVINFIWYISKKLCLLWYLKGYSQTCPCGHLYLTVTCIKTSYLSCPVIESFIWIEPCLKGHLSYKATFSLSQRWSLNTSLTVFSKKYWLRISKQVFFFLRQIINLIYISIIPWNNYIMF